MVRELGALGDKLTLKDGLEVSRVEAPVLVIRHNKDDVWTALGMSQPNKALEQGEGSGKLHDVSVARNESERRLAYLRIHLPMDEGTDERRKVLGGGVRKDSRKVRAPFVLLYVSSPYCGIYTVATHNA